MEKAERSSINIQFEDFPWWLVIIGLVILVTIILIINAPTFNEAFTTMIFGISTTLSVTLIAYGISLVIGLIVGLGRISSNTFSKNLATFYIETRYPVHWPVTFSKDEAEKAYRSANNIREIIKKKLQQHIKS